MIFTRFVMLEASQHHFYNAYYLDAYEIIIKAAKMNSQNFCNV